MAPFKYILRFRIILLIVLINVSRGDAELPKLTGTHELIGYCAPYHGKVCKSYIKSNQVWYSNVSDLDK